MPIASNELRHKMELWFGDPIGDVGPTNYLKYYGFVLTKRYTWILPKPDHKLTEMEKSCILFLIEEWDFDGVEVRHVSE